jgi:hypothetical protein
MRRAKKLYHGILRADGSWQDVTAAAAAGYAVQHTTACGMQLCERKAQQQHDAAPFPLPLPEHALLLGESVLVIGPGRPQLPPPPQWHLPGLPGPTRIPAAKRAAVSKAAQVLIKRRGGCAAAAPALEDDDYGGAGAAPEDDEPVAAAEDEEEDVAEDAEGVAAEDEDEGEEEEEYEEKNEEGQEEDDDDEEEEEEEDAEQF